MFSWHETTLRNLCRAAFGLLVLLPTCGVLLAILWCRSPLSLEYHRRALAEHLALDVRLEQVSFPRPGVTLYEGLALVDPRSGHELARCRALRCEVDAATTSIECSQAELLDSSRLELAAELAGRALRRLAGTKNRVEIDAAQLTLNFSDASPPQTLTEVHVQLQTAAEEPQATIEFHLAGDEGSQAARLAWLASSSIGNAGGSLTIETGSVPLPARLIELGCPGWERGVLGANFRGQLAWRPTAEGFSGMVSGELLGIDLDHLVSAQSKYRLSGIADVKLEEVRVKHGRLVAAYGAVQAGPGFVRRSLLAALADELHATGNSPSVDRLDEAAYSKMAFHFAIDEKGVTIHGQCADPHRALLLGETGAVLLGEPPGTESVLGLARMVASSGDIVPADPAAQALLRLLPVPLPPPAPATVEETQVPPSARLLPHPPLRQDKTRQ